jgi:hypothetical protein
VLLEGKRYVRMFFAYSLPTKISHKELLVYCYRAWKDQFAQIPSALTVSRSTGLKYETVKHCDQALAARQMLRSDLSVVQPTDEQLNSWFRVLPDVQVTDLTGDHPHWSRWLQYWYTYVKEPGHSLLTPYAVAVYSLLRTSLNGWKPPRGWSKRYIASIIRIEEHRVAEAIRLLQESRFLTYTDQRITLYKLRPPQLECFAACPPSVDTGPQVDGEEVDQPVSPKFSQEKDQAFRNGQQTTTTSNNGPPALKAATERMVTMLRNAFECGQPTISEMLTNIIAADRKDFFVANWELALEKVCQESENPVIRQDRFHRKILEGAL